MKKYTAKRSLQKGIIFSNGTYPIGSWHQRIRMMKKGFESNNIDFEYIVPFPEPTFEVVHQSEEFVKFILRPVKVRKKKNIFYIFRKIHGTIKGARYVSMQKNIDFIILPGLDFIEGILIKYVCRRKGIRLFAEVVDENGKLYSEEKLSLVDRLSKYNKIAYERLVLKKAEKIFVISSYLEDKYRKMFPNKEIHMACPTMIDLPSFNEMQLNDIMEIKQKNISVLNEADTVKIIYAGACNRTNGLRFFLECLSEIRHFAKSEIRVVFFFVYGDVEKVRDICKVLKIDDIVSFFSPVYPKYIPAIYNHSDILLIPEHGDIVANAGFPGKVSEYLASGKAIISTDFSDLAVYLKDGKNAMISPIGDKEKYCKNLLKIVDDPGLRNEIGMNAIETAKTYFNTYNAVKCYLENDER